jgi:hypothetical protein
MEETMALKITALSAAPEAGKMNGEWMLIANEGENPFNAEGCSITVAKGSARPRLVTTLQAGLVIKPKETCRLVTGSSGKKSHGEPPTEENIRNVHLFLKATYLDRSGLVIRLMNRQLELCRAAFDPTAPSGVIPSEN